MRTENNTIHDSLASKIAKLFWNAGRGTDESTEELFQSTPYDVLLHRWMRIKI